MNDNNATPATILVTGLSGAGRATALNALEDCGFHRVDNLPADLIPHLIENNPTTRALALGLGSRKTDREYVQLLEILQAMSETTEMSLLFLEANPDTIKRRYNETRRVHPNAQQRSISAAIAREQEMLADLRQYAKVIIDTSNLSPHELRAEIMRQFDLGGSHQLQMTVQSFSYKFGTPPNADMVIDCRFLRNPHWEASLRELDGRDAAVQEFVKEDENFSRFHDDLQRILGYVLPAYVKEGRSYFSIAFGCTGGKHRSVTLAEIMARELKNNGYDVNIDHRELTGARV